MCTCLNLALANLIAANFSAWVQAVSLQSRSFGCCLQYLFSIILKNYNNRLCNTCGQIGLLDAIVFEIIHCWECTKGKAKGVSGQLSKSLVHDTPRLCQRLWEGVPYMTSENHSTSWMVAHEIFWKLWAIWVYKSGNTWAWVYVLLGTHPMAWRWHCSIVSFYCILFIYVVIYCLRN